MLYNDSVLKQNPIASGYQVQFFVGYGETGQDTSAATNLGFQSGSGRFFVELPKFAVTGLAFEGKAALEKPTGTNRKLVSDYVDLTDVVNLTCFLSGDLNGQSGLALQNIKSLSVYTGQSDKFVADVISGTNLVKKLQVGNLTPDSNLFNIKITSEDIFGKTDEVLGYQVVPQDFLTYGVEGIGVSGIMFGGFEDFPTITNTGITVSRGTLNDLRFSLSKGPVEIFTGCNIFFDSGIVLDFDADFRIQTTGDIILSGLAGAKMTGTSSTISNSNVFTSGRAGIVIKNSINDTFKVNSIRDSNNRRTSFLVNIL